MKEAYAASSANYKNYSTQELNPHPLLGTLGTGHFVPK